MRPLVILSELSPKPRRETSLAFFFSCKRNVCCLSEWPEWQRMRWFISGAEQWSTVGILETERAGGYGARHPLVSWADAHALTHTSHALRCSVWERSQRTRHCRTEDRALNWGDKCSMMSDGAFSIFTRDLQEAWGELVQSAVKYLQLKITCQWTAFLNFYLIYFDV